MERLVVNTIKASEDSSAIIRQINNVNNEMAQSINMLLSQLESSQKEIETLKKANSSLNVKLGESSSLKSGLSIRRKTSVKNVKLGETDASTVASDTLYKASDGDLMWVNSSGAHISLTS